MFRAVICRLMQSRPQAPNSAISATGILSVNVPSMVPRSLLIEWPLQSQLCPQLTGKIPVASRVVLLARVVLSVALAIFGRGITIPCILLETIVAHEIFVSLVNACGKFIGIWLPANSFSRGDHMVSPSEISIKSINNKCKLSIIQIQLK